MKKLFFLFISAFSLGLGLVNGQSLTVNEAVAEGLPFANNNTFSLGKLTVKVQLPAGATTADITVTLPNGIEFLPSSIQNLASNGTIVYQTSSQPSQPVFRVTGAAAGSVVHFSFERKVTKTGYNTIKASTTLLDKVEATSGGANASRDSNPYTGLFPVAQVKLNETVHNNASGSAQKVFRLFNSGVGQVKYIYFSVKYPTGITPNGANAITAPTGFTLTTQGTVPSGFANAGATLYRVERADGTAFQQGETHGVDITERYTVVNCDSGRKINYEAYFGDTATNLYDVSSTNRTINVASGTPNIVLRDVNTETYFKWIDGICGNTLGELTVTLENKGTGNGTAYDFKLEIRNYPTDWIRFRYHRPTNFRIVYTAGGTEIEIPINVTASVANAHWVVDLNSRAELAASSLPDDIGLEDVDGDGFKDDLRNGKKITFRYDLVKTRDAKCLQQENGLFAIFPRLEAYYKDACGVAKDSEEISYATQTIYRYISGASDQSVFPVELFQNDPQPGILSWQNSAYYSFKRFKGEDATQHNVGTSTNRFLYQIQLPQGVSLKNIKYYAGTYPAGTLSSAIIPDTAPGALFQWESFNDIKGYLTFDMVLTTPCNAGTPQIDYKIVLRERHSGVPNCDIEVICGSVPIRLVCPSTGCAGGPEIVFTKTERADNSLGWTDHTMTTRAIKTSLDRATLRRALYLDDIEVTARGIQHTVNTNNLYYHFKTINGGTLEPKTLKFKVLGTTHEREITAPFASNILTLGTYTVTYVAEGKTVTDTNQYYTWNLSSLLPAGGLSAGANFEVLVTYQVKSGIPTDPHSNAKATDYQSAGQSFFYTSASAGATGAIPAGQQVHPDKLYCGTEVTPTFYIAGTYVAVVTNAYNIKGCEESGIGGHLMFTGRRFNTSGIPFVDFRPGHLIKKFVIKIPRTYELTRNFQYIYRKGYGADVIGGANNNSYMDVPYSNFTIIDDGTYKIYTYVNPAPGQPGHLPSGAIAVENQYNGLFRVWMRATCGSEPEPGTTEKVHSEWEFEDFYYYHKARGGQTIANYVKNNHEVYYTQKPGITLTSQSQLEITANKKRQSVLVSLNNSTLTAAPYTWLAVPDAPGIKVLSVEQVDATNTTVLRTEAQKTAITGQYMVFLGENNNSGTLNTGASNTRYYRITYEITNCTAGELPFSVYAGWNCASYPMGGYQQTCNDNVLNFKVKVARSVIQIAASSTNPGEEPEANGIGKIKMCTKNKYAYTISSSQQGDIFNPRIVIVKQQGITISDMLVEYPQGSGMVYSTTSTPAIGVSTVGNKTTYDLSAILASTGGVLPGSISANEQKESLLDVSFNITPDCDFRIGSKFEIDMEGDNLCGKPAEGNKTTAIIAGIEGVTSNDYTVNNTLTAINGGNANLCATAPAKFEGFHKISVVGGTASFTTNDKGSVVVTIPEGYEYVPNSFVATERSSNAFNHASFQKIENNGDKTDLYINIPEGMKNDDYFKYTIEVRQKANTQAVCTSTPELEYYTIDKVSGITCPGGTTNPCPDMPFVTSTQKRKVAIPVMRPDISLTNVVATTVVDSNKEKVTVAYKVANSATSSMTLTGDLKVSLYYDTNNSGTIEEGTDEELKTETLSGLNLGIGATSATQTIVVTIPEQKVCRLLLSVRNSKNLCLCNDKVVSVNVTPNIVELIPGTEVCEFGEKTLPYNSQAPEYVQYRWEAITANALAHLSAHNVKNPVFKYTGTDITADTDIYYNLFVRRTGGCETKQEVKVTVKPAAAAPTIAAQAFCSPATVLTLKTKLNGANPNNVKVYYSGVALSDATALTTQSYQVSYADASGCETEKATVAVTVATCNIVANDDTFRGVAPSTSPVVLGNILTNDRKGTATATTADVDIKNVTLTSGQSGTIPTISATGDVTLPAGTPEGTYEFTYQICDKIVTTDCKTAKVTIVVSGKLDAVNDNMGTFTTKDGGVSSVSVFANDKEGTDRNAIVPANVNLQWGAFPAGLTGNADGTISVGQNVPAGIYNVSYTICEKTNTTNCDTATATVYVKDIDAVNDTQQILPKEGGVVSVLTNDVVKLPTGNVPATTANVDIAITEANGSGAIVTPDGKINIPATAPAGTYVIEYQICTKDVPVACDKATIRIVKLPEIKAEDDAFSVVYSTTTQFAGNVLTNPAGLDLLNGVGATPLNVVITTVSLTSGQTGTVPTISTGNGQVSVPANTPSGVYVFTYTICELDNANLPTTNCDTANVTVTVNDLLVANDDAFTSAVNGATGGNAGNVLSGTGADTLNGVAVNINQVNLVQTSSTSPKITLDPATGNITVAPGTASGTYTLTYQICTKTAPIVCDTATVTVVVGQAQIDAVNDTTADIPSVDGKVGGTTPSVLANDSLNGNVPTVGATGTVSLTWQTTAPVGVTLNSDGTITISPNTLAGTHTIVYNICEKLNPANCDTATVTLVITAQQIDAKDDTFAPVGGVTTVTAGNVLADNGNGADVQGTTALTIGTVSLTTVSSTSPNITLDPATGNVIVGAGTASGTYTLVYKVCEILNLDNCDTATATVVVTAGTINAVDDTTSDIPSVDGKVGGTTPSVLANDSLNGSVPTVGATGTVSLTWQTTPPTGVTLNANGTITVSAGTPAGTHTIVYNICEKLNPTNCDTATVTLVITAQQIDAKDDTFPSVGGVTTVTAGNVLADNGNGVDVQGTTALTIGTVSLTTVSSTSPNITLDPATGNVIVGAGTASGTYTLVYKVCEILNPTNCDTATATVVVTAAPFTISGVTPVVTDTTTSTKTIGVVTGVPSQSIVSTTMTITPPTGWTTNTNTGEVSVPQNTPSGVYTVTITVCEVLNPVNCSSATSSVTVINPIVATTDLYTVVQGGTSTGTILNNDVLGSVSATTANVTFTSTNLPTGITLDADGKINVTPTIPANTYTFTYEICEVGATTPNCTQTQVTVVVTTATGTTTTPKVTATDDTYTYSSTTTYNVLDNDRVDTATATTSLVTINIVTPATGTVTPSIDVTTGQVIVPVGTPEGTYTITYEICTITPTGVCDAATLVVTVPANTIQAFDELITVFENTTYSGTIRYKVADAEGHSHSWTPQADTSNGHRFELKSDGSYVFTPQTGFTGLVSYVYEVCDDGLPTSACATATITINVISKTASNTLVANPDTVTTKESIPVIINVLANDFDPEGHTFTITANTTPSNGILVRNTDGTFTYTPNATFVGTDNFSYTICDDGTPQECRTASVTITVISSTTNITVANDDSFNTDKNRPLMGNVLSNDTDPEGNTQSVITTPVVSPKNGTLILNSDGTFTYTPNADYVGNDSFVYSVCDNGSPSACANAVVNITINDIEGPIAVADYIRSAVVPVIIPIVSNDINVPANGLIELVIQPKNGTAVINDNGTPNEPSDDTLVYRPNTGFYGKEEIAYRLCDGLGNCSVATITIDFLSDLTVFNGVSFNGDGQNDYFHIGGIEQYPNNVVRIYNRWGVKVFEVSGYNNTDKVFKGVSTGRVTVEALDKLPQGTYYYVLEYTEGTRTTVKTGWLYLKK